MSINVARVFRRTEFSCEVAGSSTAIPLKAMAFSRPATIATVICTFRLVYGSMCIRACSCACLLIACLSVWLSLTSVSLATLCGMQILHVCKCHFFIVYDLSTRQE